MRKASYLKLIMIAALVFLFVGCSKLPEILDTESGVVTSTQTTTMPTQTAGSTTASMETSSPAPTATLPPGADEEARFYADVDGDGADETIIVYSEEGVDSDRILLGVLDESSYDEIVIDEEMCYFGSAYATQTQNGGYCILICCEDAVDRGGDTAVCSFNGTVPILHGMTVGLIDRINGIHLTLSDWDDFIGSWDFVRDYELSNNFTLKPISEMMISMDGGEPLHTIRELPVEMLVDGAYVADTLPSGTFIYPTAGDGESYMCFWLEDGSEGRIDYTRGESYNAMIGGVSEYECFDNVDYWS